MNRKAWGIGGITLTKENWSTPRKTQPSATLSNTNNAWTGTGLNLSLHSDTPVTNCLRNNASFDLTLMCLIKHHTKQACGEMGNNCPRS
jgi:hypothetical protein